ncbi:MAG: FG-GAP-like repeat-containing protein [Lentisphaeria bacterium]|nr:FG-GAP-like repeat-containing protein [Candidatus Neomarinimicrobiota bacterium]MCF7841561.1 FG-GAP-like repeat-containing protein [Lentisphaeria bacterium]
MTLTTDTWHHIAVVYKPDNVLFYFNGEQFSLGAAPVEQGTTLNLRIGSAIWGQCFQGSIDEVRIWNDERTQTEIQTHYGSLAGNEDNLVAYWRFDENSGTTAGDATGHSYTGTLVNAPTWVTSSGAAVSAPVFSASPSSHDFGDVLIGESAQQNITIANTGGGVLNISAVSTPGAAYSVSPGSANIPAGSNQVFSLTFTPTTSGAQNGNLSFTDNTGTNNVAITGSGVFEAQAGAEKALTFNAANSQYLVIPDAFQPTAYTMEMWVKPSTGTAENLFMRTNSSDPLSFYSQQLYINSDGHFSHYIFDGNSRYVTSSTTAEAGTWYHIAISAANDGLMHLYINGLEEGTPQSIVTMQGNLDQYRISAATKAGLIGYFTGEVDEVRLWNTLRTATQLQANYGSLTGSEAGLVGYWRCDEGSGSTIGDGTGNNHAATLVNAPTWANSTAPVAAPVYQTSSSTVAVGNVTVNTSGDATVTLTNAGGGFLSIAALVSDNALFTVSPTSANIATGADQIITVNFAPTTHGSESGTLTLTHNPNSTTNTISLTGTGQQAVFSASTSNLDFGNAQVNASSEQTVTVTNNGNITLSISDITCNPSEYAISPTTAEITAGNDQVFTVTLTPTATGAVPGTITFTDNALDSPQAITVTGTGVELYGSGTEGDPYQIGCLNDLLFLSNTTNSDYWSAHFIQTGDIDASSTATLNSSTGFIPIGNIYPHFSGVFNGGGHIINDLYINRSGTDYQGLFGKTSGAIIKNLNLTNVSITGKAWVGALVADNGYGSATSIENCSSSGSVTGNGEAIGGLVGKNGSGSTISTSFSSCSTTMLGANWSCGGLVGHNPSSNVINSYATGTVTGTNAVGGLIGNNTSGIVTNCFSTGAVSGTGSYIGGLIGGFSYQVNNCFWDTLSSGQLTSNGGSGITTGEMQIRSTFTNAGWDFKDAGTNDIWNMGNSRNSGYPYLDWQYPSDPVIELATLTTTAASEITTTSVTTGGEVTNNVSGEAVTERGICWETASNPETTDSYISIGSGVGSFSSSITELSAGTGYHVRAYAINLAGTAYGDDISFTTFLEPTVTTQAVSDIASTTATGNGTITVLGVPNPTQHGMVWGTEENPTFLAGSLNGAPAAPIQPASTKKSKLNKAVQGTQMTVTSVTLATSDRTEEGEATSTGAFTSVMTGLLPNTTYHVRTYATNSVATVYGSDVTFTTLPSLPTVTTQAVSDIGITTATGNGNITDLGVPDPTQHGICWSTSSTPTVADDTTASGTVLATGVFTSALTGLISNTTYYVRAYATNTAGTAYGNEVSFTTLPTLATVTTGTVSEITQTTATGNGNVTDVGIPDPTQHGFCWSISTSPTVADDTTANGPVSATGAFTGELTGLASYETYYVRAYVTNTAGTAYGDQVSFTTLPTAPTVTTQAVSDISIITATGNGAVTGLGVPNPTQHGICWSTSSAPTVADSKSEEGAATSTGAFTTAITGLSGLSTYYVRAYATNAAGTVYGNEVSFSTSADEPTTPASEIVFSDPDKGKATISWTNGNGSKRAVFLKQASSGSVEPVDHTTYTANSAFGSGTQIGTTGWYCVYNGTGTTVDITGLTQLSTYCAMVFEYNGAGGGENYSVTTATNNPASYTLPNFAEETGLAMTQNSQSKAAWGDMDNDGDLDVVVMGMNGAELYQNNNDQTFTKLSGHGLSNYYGSPLQWEDFDHDGYLDLFMTTGNYMLIYRNLHDNTFTQVVNFRTSTDYYQILAFVDDYNRDSYPDILVVGSDGTYYTKLYKNNGDWTFTAQADIVFDQLRYGTAAWGDYDNDGYDDLFMTGVTAENGYTAKLYKNIGGADFVAQTDGMPWIPVQQGTAAWGDYNNDGYLDLVVVGYNMISGVGYVPGKLYKNNGDNTFTDQSGIVFPSLTYPAVAWGDYNSDGLADLVMNGRNNSWGVQSNLFTNNGDNTFSEATDGQLPGAYKGSMTWNDYDNDGDLDLFVTGDATTSSYTGIDKLYENIGGSPNTPPSAPTNLQVSVTDKITFSWNKATDTETSQNGLNYNVFIGTGATNGNTLSPSADISSGKRRIVRSGNVGSGTSYTINELAGGDFYWGVQAIDAGHAGGPFASGTFSNIGPASNISVTDNRLDRMTIHWSNGVNGENRMVFVKEGLTGSPLPVNGSTYTANAALGQGAQIGSSGWYCVYAGSGDSVMVTGVTPTTTYRIAVIEYAGVDENRYYLSRSVPGNPRNRFPVVGGSGNALTFDGTDDYISAAPDVPSGTEPFTVEAWVKTEQTQSRTIVGWGNSSNRNTYNFGFSTASISGTWNNIGFGYDLGYYAPGMVVSGKWTHVAYSFDGSTPLKLYVNGVLIGQLFSMGTSYEGNTNFNVGARYSSSMESFFDGSVDALRIWDEGRTQDQIKADMCRKLKSTDDSHLIVCYNFDQASNSTELYCDNPVNDGTLNNFDTANAWTKSGALMGAHPAVVQNTTPTQIGNTGQSVNVTLTNTPNASNYLHVYYDTNGLGPVTTADVGSWPEGVVKRADIIWGVHEIGDVTANLTIDYSQVAGINSPDLVRLIKRPDGCSGWIDVTSDFTHNLVDRTFAKLGNTSFSEFSLGTMAGDNSLPVQLSSFTAENTGGGVNLKWTTESEIENLGYLLERQSLQDSIWTLVADYESNEGLVGQGSTNDQTQYDYYDGSVQSGTTYRYRLSDVDYQGNVKQHPVIEITATAAEIQLPTEFALRNIYPNPFNPTATVDFALPEPAEVSIVIYNILGQQVTTLVNTQLPAGYHKVRWHGENAAAGIYFCRMQVANFSQTRKILLLK